MGYAADEFHQIEGVGPAGATSGHATIDEIMEVLKLCGAQAIDACELGAPILSEELANRRSAAQPPDL
jgi:hypothetical protein